MQGNCNTMKNMDVCAWVHNKFSANTLLYESVCLVTIMKLRSQQAQGFKPVPLISMWHVSLSDISNNDRPSCVEKHIKIAIVRSEGPSPFKPTFVAKVGL